MALISHFRLIDDAKDALMRSDLLSSDLVFEDNSPIGPAANATNGTSAVFDVEGTFMDDPTLCEELSVSCRIRPRTITAGYVLSTGSQTSSAWGISFDVYQGNFRPSVSNDTHVWQLMFPCPDVNRRYDVTFTWSLTDGLKLYVDGELVASAGTPIVHGRAANNHHTLSIGRPNNVSNYYFDGHIADVRIYDHELSKHEARWYARDLTLDLDFAQGTDATQNQIHSPFNPANWSDGSRDPNFGFVSDATVDVTMPDGETIPVYQRTCTGTDWQGVRQDIYLTAGTDMSIYHTGSIEVRALDPKVGCKVRLSFQGVDDTGGLVDVHAEELVEDEGWRRVSISALLAKAGFASLDGRLKIYLESPSVTTWQIARPQYQTSSYPTRFVVGQRDGRVRDLSRFENDITLLPNVSPAMEVSPSVRQGMLFKRHDLSVPNKVRQGNFSISAWCIWDKDDDWVVDHGNAGNYYASIVHIPGMMTLAVHVHNDVRILTPVTVYWRQNADTVYRTYPFVWGEWSLVTMTYDADSGVLTTYVNDRKLWEKVVTFPSVYDATIHLGDGSVNGNEYANEFVGPIGRVRQYAGCLSEEDVAQLYASRATLTSKGALHFDGSVSESVSWLPEVSRHNLVNNGDGRLKDATNMASFTYVQAGPNESYFSRVGRSEVVICDEDIPVIGNGKDQWDRYAISCEIRGGIQPSRYYFMISCYDRNGRRIAAQDANMRLGSGTTVAQAVNPGDEWVYLTSVSNWTSTYISNTTYNNFCYWLDDPEPYDVYKYTRRREVYTEVDVANNRVRFANGWPGPALPAGTPVMNSWSGSTFSYIGGANILTDLDNWVYREGITQATHVDRLNNMRYGTSFIRLGWLVNRNVSTSAETQIRNVRCWNVDRPQSLTFKGDGRLIDRLGNGIPSRVSEVPVVGADVALWMPLRGRAVDLSGNSAVAAANARPKSDHRDYTSGLGDSLTQPVVLKGDFTIAFSMSPRRDNAFRPLNAADYDDSPIWVPANNRIELPYNQGGARGMISLSDPILANVWQHYAMTRTGDTTSFYVNGVYQGSYSGWAGDVEILRIGLKTDNTGWTDFDGRLRDLQIERSALSGKDVQRLADRSLGNGSPMSMNDGVYRLAQTCHEVAS